MVERADISSSIRRIVEDCTNPSSEVVIVRQEDQAKEVMVFQGLGEISIGSNNYASIIKTTRQLTREAVERYGEGTDFVFINKAGYMDLLRNDDDSPLATFIRNIDYSKLPLRIFSVI